MFCKKCGNEIKPGQNFCLKCGAPVGETLSPAPQSANSAQATPRPVPQMPKVKKPSKFATMPKKKKIAIAVSACVALVLIITGIVAISNLAETAELKRAIDSKSGSRVYEVYSASYGDSKKRQKYDEIIADTISEIKNNLNAHDFDEAAQTSGESAVEQYLASEYGTLVSDSATDLSASVSSVNQTAWDDLDDLIDSKENYCDGLYAYKTEQDYETAIDYFQGVLSSDSEYSDSVTMIGECADGYIQAALAQVDAYVQDGDIDGGMELLRSAQEYLESVGQSSAEVQEKMNTVMTTYADSYMQKAETEFLAGDVNAAVGNVEAAIAINPNGDYQAKLDEYKMYLPFALYEEENILQEKGSDYGAQTFPSYFGGSHSETANDNHTYSNVIEIRVETQETREIARAYYNLQGQYDTVSGTIFLSQDNKSTSVVGYFEAYGDGKLLYTSPTVQAGVLPQDFSFSVSGVQNLEIRYYGSGVLYWAGIEYCVADLTAQKNIPQ